MRLNKNAIRQDFKKFAYPHMKLLYNVALKYTGNTFDAEDIVQETYLMAFNKFHQLKDRTRVKPWLLRILRNNFLKSCQKIKKQQKLTETDYVEFIKPHIRSKNAEEVLVNASSIKIINAAIEKLPAKYKEILTLYYMEEMLYKDIAKTLDIPIGTVMSRLTRARDGLKIHLLKQMAATKENVLNLNVSQ